MMTLAKIKELLEQIEKPIIKFFLFSCLDTSVGAVGMIVYGILTATYGPVWIRNQFIGLWLMTIIFFISVNSIYIEIRSWKRKVYFYLDLGFFIIATILPLLLTIFYGISKRIDAIIWSIYIFAVNLTNISILYLRRNNLNKLNQTEAEEVQDGFIKMKESSERPEDKYSKIKAGLKRTIKIINFILRIFFIVIFCLLLNGAIIEGVGRINYPERGKYSDVKIADSSSKTIRVQFLCDGPKNDQPVFLFEGSASHGMGDYLGLQILLKQQNRRSCIWDKPGVGYSDYLYTEMKSYSSMYHNLITSLGETGPFDFVGWGAGGSIMYEYAYNHPEMFKSLTFIDVSPLDIEFTIPATLKNWTDAQKNQYKNSELASRMSLIKLINGIGVPFGLMQLVFPGYKSYFSNLYNEINWFYLIEKTWITQEYFLGLIKEEKNVFDLYKINQSIPINLIMTVKSDDQIKNLICKKRSYSFDSSECKYEIDSNNLSIGLRRQLYNLSTNGKIFNCTLDDCDLGYYTALGSNYTVDKLIQL